MCACVCFYTLSFMGLYIAMETYVSQFLLLVIAFQKHGQLHINPSLLLHDFQLYESPIHNVVSTVNEECIHQADYVSFILVWFGLFGGYNLQCSGITPGHTQGIVKMCQVSNLAGSATGKARSEPLCSFQSLNMPPFIISQTILPSALVTDIFGSSLALEEK